MRSFEAKIFVGFKEKETGKIHTLAECERICQEFVNDNPKCVTVTSTKFIYTNGSESGAIIGFIQYPRFPEWISEIKKIALELAEILMTELNQFRVTVNFPDEVVMLSNPKFVKEPEETSKM